MEACAVVSIGELVMRESSMPASSLDAVVVEGSTLEIRLPWTLLQVADPSSLQVIHDDRETPGTETQTTEGIAISVVLGGEVLLTSERYLWEAWDVAPPHGGAGEALAAAARGLPERAPRCALRS